VPTDLALSLFQAGSTSVGGRGDRNALAWRRRHSSLPGETGPEHQP